MIYGGIIGTTTDAKQTRTWKAAKRKVKFRNSKKREEKESGCFAFFIESDAEQRNLNYFLEVVVRFVVV